LFPRWISLSAGRAEVGSAAVVRVLWHDAKTSATIPTEKL